MNYLTHQLLNAEEINFIEKELEQEIQGWDDGKKTAGSHASIVKNNLQLKRKSDISKKLSLLIKQKILNNELIKSLSLIHISEPTRHLRISYAVFCLKKKNRLMLTIVHVFHLCMDVLIH